MDIVAIYVHEPPLPTVGLFLVTCKMRGNSWCFIIEDIHFTFDDQWMSSRARLVPMSASVHNALYISVWHFYILLWRQQSRVSGLVLIGGSSGSLPPSAGQTSLPPACCGSPNRGKHARAGLCGQNARPRAQKRWCLFWILRKTSISVSVYSDITHVSGNGHSSAYMLRVCGDTFTQVYVWQFMLY